MKLTPTVNRQSGDREYLTDIIRYRWSISRNYLRQTIVDSVLSIVLIDETSVG